MRIPYAIIICMLAYYFYGLHTKSIGPSVYLIYMYVCVWYTPRDYRNGHVGRINSFFVGAKNIKSRENSNNEGNFAQSKSEKKQIEIFLSKSHIGQFKNSKFTSTCFYLIYVSTIYNIHVRLLDWFTRKWLSSKYIYCTGNCTTPEGTHRLRERTGVRAGDRGPVGQLLGRPHR